MSALNFQRALVITFIVWALLMLAGCSTAGALTGLIGSKPEVSAQVGAENTKQTLGLNSKVDASSEVANEVKNSNVGKLDGSTGKKVSASSIQAETITADKIEIRNTESSPIEKVILAVTFAVSVAVLCVYFLSRRRTNKGA